MIALQLVDGRPWLLMAALTLSSLACAAPQRSTQARQPAQDRPSIPGETSPPSRELEAAPRLGDFPHEPGLFQVLAMEPGAAQFDALIAYESQLGFQITDTLVDIAEDPARHALLRANAILLVGRRHDLADFIILQPLLDASDARIRLAVVVAAQHYLPVMEKAVLALLAVALEDSEVAVQARALEGITDKDVTILRNYIARDPTPGLEAVALGLVAAAEERGAPLVPDSAGTLQRMGPGGHTLEYRPDGVWPLQDLSVGPLTLRTADGRQIEVGDSIEVARNVVPAFFSSDGAYLVFEESRMIRVLDIGTGADRVIGPGVAPRPLPFTNDIIFARLDEDGTTKTRSRTQLSYSLLRTPFAPGHEPVQFSTASAVSTFEVSGGASPLRWMRVSELDGSFRLIADGMDPSPLPDPFAGPGGPM